MSFSANDNAVSELTKPTDSHSVSHALRAHNSAVECHLHTVNGSKAAPEKIGKSPGNTQRRLFDVGGVSTALDPVGVVAGVVGIDRLWRAVRGAQ